jgi:transposase-like protein
MRNLLFLVAIVLSVGYALSKSKCAKPEPKLTQVNLGAKKAKGVRWICNRCGNSWLVYVDVPKNYKKLTNIIGTKGGFTEIDGEDLYPWICSDCHSSSETQPKK